MICLECALSYVYDSPCTNKEGKFIWKCMPLKKVISNIYEDMLEDCPYDRDKDNRVR